MAFIAQYSSLPSWSCSGFCIFIPFCPNGIQDEQTVEAPSVDARASILMDYASGKVLAEGNADEKLDPASLTKIMTSYVVRGQRLRPIRLNSPIW
ncbi:hypothetical protein ACNKHL_04660 [Shigella flexneri]